MNNPTWLELGRLAELGLLSSTLVHEIKQPLFAIKAWLQLFVPLDESSLELRNRLMEQVLHMEKLLDGYGGLTRRPGEWKEPFQIDIPVKNAISTLQNRAEKLGIKLFYSSENLPIINGNPVALQQIVVNLLQNSIDAVIDVPDPTIQVSLSKYNDGVCLQITDNGTGILEEHQTRVFEPFFTTKAPGCGTGLGLAIVSKLVEIAKGSLEISSTSGKTTVTVIYPGGEQ